MNKLQGDTTDIVMTLSEALPEGLNLKIGLYNTNGKALWETYYPEDGLIQKVDSTHFTLKLDYETTRKFAGNTTLRGAIFSPGHDLVNAGENSIPISWIPEPVTKNLR